jgi:hypothetical protein
MSGGLMMNCFVAPMIYHPVERHMVASRQNKMAAKPETEKLLLPAPAQRKCGQHIYMTIFLFLF